MQAVKTLDEHENFIAKCYVTLYCCTLRALYCSLEQMRCLKSGFVGFIKKTKAGEQYHGSLRTFDEAIARFVGGNFNCWVYTPHWMYPLSQHSNELSNRNTPRRFYHLLDWVGAYVPNCRHGTRWCNKCATIADTVFSDEQDCSLCKGMYKYNVSLVYIFFFQFKKYVKYLCKMDSRRLKNATQ